MGPGAAHPARGGKRGGWWRQLGNPAIGPTSSGLSQGSTSVCHLKSATLNPRQVGQWRATLRPYFPDNGQVE